MIKKRLDYMTLLLVGVPYFGKEIYGMLFVHDRTTNLAHIAGGICRTLAGFIMERKGTQNESTYKRRTL